MKTLIFASYNGSQNGFTVRNHKLEQESAVGISFEIKGIAADTNGDVFLTGNNSLYHCEQDGTLINQMEFPDTTQYTNVIVAEDKIIASYSGAQRGFTIRNKHLEEVDFVETDFEIMGLAAGVNDDLFLVSSYTLYHYKTDGTFVEELNVDSIAGYEYMNVTTSGSKIIIAHDRLEESDAPSGFTVMSKVPEISNMDGFGAKPPSNQGGFGGNPDNMGGFGGNSGNWTSRFVTTPNLDTIGIAAGINNDVFFVSGDSIYHYSLEGEQLAVKTFGDTSISYNQVSVLITN